MRRLLAVVVFFYWQSASVAATFVGEAQAKFRVAEFLEGSSSSVERLAPITFILETDYTQVEWSINFDVDLLMAGGPDQHYETRFKAKGYLKTDAPSTLTFPDAFGGIAAGRYDLYGMGEWSLFERIVNVTATHEIAMHPIGGPQHIQGISLADYPDSLRLTHNIKQAEAFASFEAIKLGPENSIRAEIIGLQPADRINLRPLLPGDFSGDGSVDAADYTVWRESPGIAPLLTSYDVWRNGFGSALSAPSGVSPVQVPEPATATLLLTSIWAGLAGRFLSRRQAYCASRP